MFGIEHEQDEDDSEIPAWAETPASSRKDRQTFTTPPITKGFGGYTYSFDPTTGELTVLEDPLGRVPAGYVVPKGSGPYEAILHEMGSAMDRKRAQEALARGEMPAMTETIAAYGEPHTDWGPPRATKDRQQFINDYATRAIANGMDPSQAWAQGNNMADRAINFGHIEADIYETEAAMDRAPAFRRPETFEEMRQGAARRAMPQIPATVATPEPLTAPPSAKKKPDEDEASLEE